MRKLRLTAILLLIWGGVPGSTLAFEQQPPAATPKSALPSPTKKDAKDPEREKIELESTQESAGTRWKIPGLGSFDILPKMDFGLELLYSDESESYVDENADGDDVRIRGTVKRRF